MENASFGSKSWCQNPGKIIAKQDLHQRAIVAMIYEQRREQTVNLVFLLQTLYHHINHLFLYHRSPYKHYITV